MKTIWKCTLAPDSRQTVTLPRGAELLTVQVQFDLVQLWAVVDSSQPVETRYIHIVGTGHPIGFAGKYIGTFQLDGGALVFHVFEEAA